MVLIARCWASEDKRHHPENSVQYYKDDIQRSICTECGQVIERWYFEGEEDRVPGWGHWSARLYIIREQELA